MIALSDTEFRLLRGYIEQSCGISLGDEKAYLIESRLVGLLHQTGCASYSELYQKAVSDRSLGLRDKIVDAMTTNETLWFRDLHPFSILSYVILPKLVEEIRAGKRRKIRIWSAACSTGQEPYSIAMTAREFLLGQTGIPGDCVEIVATDISMSALFLSAAARYDGISITRGLPEKMRDRYFDFNGKIWALKPEIKEKVQFKKLNLQENFSFLGRFDIVFCRYVIIYFSTAFKKDLLSRIAGSLRPEGYLFLGGAESLGNYSTEFASMTHDGHVYYQVK